MGLIMIWARLAALAPRLVNALMRAPLLGRLVKWLGGVAQARTMPRFAQTTFRAWFAKNRGPTRATTGQRVILWPDTFVNHFSPEIGIAAVEVLEAAGFAVELPPDGLCCGRPLYDFGMLDRAKDELGKIIAALRPALEAGVPIVGLEPSCVAVFKDELPGLLPDDEDAKRLSAHTSILSELLRSRAPSFTIPPLHRRAVVHGHCHHKSVLGFDAEKEVLERMGLDVEVLDSGCCGMAGSFGFEAGEKLEVSRRVGELVLLPKVRAVPKDTIVLADGFSCRQQIEQSTDRRGLHLAEALQMALRHGAAGARGDYPEAAFREPRTKAKRRMGLSLLGLVVGGGLLAAALWTRRRSGGRA
jgi:Fe-S oxidoreductase